MLLHLRTLVADKGKPNTYLTIDCCVNKNIAKVLLLLLPMDDGMVPLSIFECNDKVFNDVVKNQSGTVPSMKFVSNSKLSR